MVSPFLNDMDATRIGALFFALVIVITIRIATFSIIVGLKAEAGLKATFIISCNL